MATTNATADDVRPPYTYQLPDGRLIQLAADLCHGASVIDFELKAVPPATRGRIVDAIIVRPVEAPERFRDLAHADWMKPARCCGIPAGRHYDGWDGNHLDCEEAANRCGLAVRQQEG